MNRKNLTANELSKVLLQERFERIKFLLRNDQTVVAQTEARALLEVEYLDLRYQACLHDMLHDVPFQGLHHAKEAVRIYNELILSGQNFFDQLESAHRNLRNAENDEIQWEAQQQNVDPSGKSTEMFITLRYQQYYDALENCDQRNKMEKIIKATQQQTAIGESSKQPTTYPQGGNSRGLMRASGNTQQAFGIAQGENEYNRIPSSTNNQGITGFHQNISYPQGGNGFGWARASVNTQQYFSNAQGGIEYNRMSASTSTQGMTGFHQTQAPGIAQGGNEHNMMPASTSTQGMTESHQAQPLGSEKGKDRLEKSLPTSSNFGTESDQTQNFSGPKDTKYGGPL